MRVLIAYASVSGTTRKCAEMLGAYLAGCDVTLADLTEERPDPCEFDFIAVGSPVRMGKLHPAAESYIRHCGTDMLNVRCGFFICCGYIDSADEYIGRLIPENLLEHAEVAVCFGGELDIKAQKRFLDRMILRMVRKFVLDDGGRDGELNRSILPEIMPDSIRRFADTVRKTGPRPL